MNQKNSYQNCSPELANLASLSPALFAIEASDWKFLAPKHIQAIDAELLKIASGENKRLIVNMPPRHGKSELISKYFPAWFLGVYPEKRIILASYEASFAASWGAKVRDLLLACGKQLFNIELSKDKRASEHFTISGHGGAMYCAGAGGAITGRGAVVIIIDDPIKNDSEANSKTYRDKVFEWFQATAYTRLEPGGAIVLVMTRWNEDDIVGRLLASNSGDWKVLRLPALAEGDDPIGRETGDALWENRYSVDDLLDIRRSIGPYWFSALYQQSPSPLEGGLFKREDFKYFSLREGCIAISDGEERLVWLRNCKIFACVDLAVSLKSTADYTVALIFAYADNGDIFVLDIRRARIEGAEHLNFLKRLSKDWSPILIGIETAQYQLSLLQSALREGLPAKELRPDKDKISRALPIAARVSAETVYFNRNAVWLQDFEHELLSFPKGAHDDQVDAFAYITEIIQPISLFSPTSKELNRQ